MMNTVLRNLTFRDVQFVPIFRALKREAKYPGWLEKHDVRYTMLQKLCNDIRESNVNLDLDGPLLRNENDGPPNTTGDVNLMFPDSPEAWQIIRQWLYNEMWRTRGT